MDRPSSAQAIPFPGFDHSMAPATARQTATATVFRGVFCSRGFLGRCIVLRPPCLPSPVARTRHGVRFSARTLIPAAHCSSEKGRLSDVHQRRTCQLLIFMVGDGQGATACLSMHHRSRTAGLLLDHRVLRKKSSLVKIWGSLDPGVWPGWDPWLIHQRRISRIDGNA